MSSGGTELDTVLKVIGLFGASGGVGGLMLKRWKPRSAALAGELDQVREDRAEDKARNDADFADLRQRMVLCESKVRQADARTRWALDYVEVLRRHISDGHAPPPPPWPKEPVFDA